MIATILLIIIVAVALFVFGYIVFQKHKTNQVRKHSRDFLARWDAEYAALLQKEKENEPNN